MSLPLRNKSILVNKRGDIIKKEMQNKLQILSLDMLVKNKDEIRLKNKIPKNITNDLKKGEKSP